MKPILFSAIALGMAATAQIVQGGGTVQLTFGAGGADVTCETTAMDFDTSGVLTVQCLGSSPVSATDPVVTAPPPVTEPPVTEPPPPIGYYIGEDEDGNPVTAADELSGAFNGTLYMPARDDYHTVVYPGGTKEVVYPGCAGLGISGVTDYYNCLVQGSLYPGVTVAQRLPVLSSLPSRIVAMDTYQTGDQLGNYDASISDYPGSLVSPGCEARATYAANFNFFPGSCGLPLSNLNNGETKVYYANFKPVGPNAEKCGSSLTCRMYVRAW